MTLFSDRIYDRDFILTLESKAIVSEGSNFNFDIGFDRRSKHDWKRRESRPKPTLERGKDAWTANHLKLDKTKVNEISSNMKKLLNKISDKNYEKILEQIIDFEIKDDPFCLNTIVKEIFEKALLEPKFSNIYAKICIELIKKYKNFPNINFERLLISHCQNFFSERDLNNLDEYDELLKKKKILGNSFFIGELCSLEILSCKLVYNECFLKLLDEKNKLNSKNLEMNMEIINCILTRCGKNFDKDVNHSKNLNELFESINSIIKEHKLSSRIRFMFMDLKDLRKKSWISHKK